MRVLDRSGAHHGPFLQLSEWPQYRHFCQYLTRKGRAAGHTLLGSQDMKAAYWDFKKQHPCPVPATSPAPHTHWLKTRTRPPGDGSGPTANPTTGPEGGQAHTDHRHPPGGKMAHTETSHDRPSLTEGPPRLPEHATHMFGQGGEGVRVAFGGVWLGLRVLCRCMCPLAAARLCGHL